MFDEDDYLVSKVVLIGESGVGKTSIIQRFITNIFNPQQKTTGGANFIEKKMEINDYKIKFEIWDTVGQERFRSLAKVFYNNASVCIMVYDITSKKSFDALKEYWSEDVKNNVSGSASKSKNNIII
jgi:small GTP-binding protein